MAGKEKMTKLTLEELIAQKEKYQRKQDVFQEIALKRGTDFLTIKIKKPSKALCLECLTMANNIDESVQEMSDIHMVYNIVVEPNLKDKKLQDAYECVEPTDIVEKLFEIGEIGQISGHGMMLAGYGTEVKVIKDLKN